MINESKWQEAKYTALMLFIIFLFIGVNLP